MTIEELKSNGAKVFITEGPNSGGVRGYYYFSGKLYSFWDDTGASGIDDIEDARGIVLANLSNENTRISTVAIALKELLTT